MATGEFRPQLGRTLWHRQREVHGPPQQPDGSRKRQDEQQTKREHTQAWVQVVRVCGCLAADGQQPGQAPTLVIGTSTCSILDAYGCWDLGEGMLGPREGEEGA